MSLYPFFQWLAETRLSAAMAASVWAFAVVEMVHLLGLTLLGGSVLLLNLRLLGLRLQRRPAAEVAHDLSPYFLASLGVLVVSGVFLTIDGPLRYYGNAAFRLKMLLLAIAIAFSCALHSRVARSRRVTVKTGERVAAAVSMALWLSVGLSGRAIGFL
jgi:predicted RND superfamily exporter protein